MKFSKYTQLILNYLSNYDYYKQTKRLLKRDFSSKEEIEDFQVFKLKEILIYAYKHVPYYRELFNNLKFNPYEFRSLEEFKQIPFLTKELVKKNKHNLISEYFPRQHIKKVQTGGTTGLPMEFSLDNRFSSLKEMLFLRHMWKRVGYRPRSRCVVLREDTVSKIVEGETYWKRNLLTNWLIMSSFHLNADTFDIFYRKIVSYKPEFIIAFPSNIYLLAKFMKEKNLNAIPSLKAIICSSENIFDWQRTFMEDIFRTRVFSYYGHSEKCVMASEGTNTNEYEFFPQYGYAEIVNDEGDHCTKNNERGEIIATGFDNFASPFIRYKTEDIAVLSTDGNTDHKHWLSIKNIEGRKQDFLIDNDEVPKSYIYIDRPFWEMKDQIYAYQYIQDKPGEVQLNVQAKEKLTRQQIENIKSTFYRTYFKMALTVHQVDHIPRTNRGKFKYLIQNIKQTQ